MSKLIIAIVLITFVSIFVLVKLDPANSPAGQDSALSIVDDNFNTLNINGEVNNAGSYIVQKDATLEELILAAGGVTTNADDRAYNESIIVTPGVSYYIAPLYAKNDICHTEPLVKVNINTASAEELQTLTGIGQVVSQAIYNYRSQNGLFMYIEEIMQVSGVGNSTFEKIKDYIILR